MKNSTLILTISSFLIGSGFSYGQNRYVSTTGNDASNDCTSQGSPCKTIQAATTAAIAGDSILIASGAYSLSGTLGLTKNDLVITAQDAAAKPVITSDASDVISVSAKGISISNLVFNMGLTSSTGMRGIVGSTGFDSLTVDNNEFLSTNPGGFLSTGMIFGSYAVLLYSPNSESLNVTITNNTVGIESTGNDVFGRGLGIGFNAGGGACGPGGLVDNNDIAAYYPIQAILVASDISLTNNHLKGMTMFNATKNGAIATFDNNVLDAVADQYAANIFTLLDIRATETGSVVVSHNLFNNYLTTAVFSMASKNVSVVGNTFSPSLSGDQFISIVANTKLQTANNQSTTYSDEITITGNMFNAGVPNKGTAIVFADHYGNNTPAFASTIVGGSLPVDKNTFDSALGNFIQLDSLSGSSDQVTLWNPGFGGDHTPATTMKPVSQDVIALATNNNYGSTDMMVIESKNIDTLDIAILGKIILGNTFPDFTGIVENKASNVFATIYPNPASSELNIVLDKSISTANIQIVDVIGNIVYANAIQAKETVDLTNLKSGVYFVKLSANNQSYSTKVIKR